MEQTSPSIIVFGGSGFIGSHLLKRLVAKGTHRIISLDLRQPPYPVSGVDYRLGDVRDLSGLSIEGPVSTLYNLAAVHTTPGHPTHAYYETNILGATEVTAFARCHATNDIVFTSSISVYGPSEDLKTEATPVAPESAYGWSKYMAERIHRAWLDEAENRRLTIVRPAVVFGPHEGGNFTRMAKLLKKGLFVYPGRKDTIKACIYVEDLLDAIDYAHETNKRLTLFNACYPDRYTIQQIVQVFQSVAFPKLREFCIPLWIVKTIAWLLRPAAFLGLGIHPDRVMKLVRSTDIYPKWLKDQGQAKNSRLPEVLGLWRDTNNFG